MVGLFKIELIMKKIYTSFFILFTLFFTFDADAQQVLEFSFSPDSDFVESDGTVEVGLHVSDFDDIVGAQFIVLWDPNILRIESIDSLTTSLPDFNEGSFALPSQTFDNVPGRLRASWFSFSGASSLPDNHRLLKMTFTVLGSDCEVAELKVDGIPFFPVEIIGPQGANIPFNSKNSSITINGNDCGNGNATMICNDEVFISVDLGGGGVLHPDMILEGGPYDFSTIELSIESISCDMIGQDIILTATDVVTGNACFGTINVEDKIPPVAIVNQGITVPLGPQGTVAVPVTTVNSNSFDNCTAEEDLIFEPLVYNFGVNDIGPNQVEMTVTDEFGNFNRVFTTIIVTGDPPPTGDDIELILADVESSPGSKVCVPMTVQNFTGITSFQASIEWDPSIIEFDAFNVFGLPGFSGNSDANLSKVDQGLLSFLWFDQTGTSFLSLADDTRLLEVCYNVVGELGEVSPVGFADGPLKVELGSSFITLEHKEKEGSVRVGSLSTDCINDIIAPTPFCISLSTALATGQNPIELFAVDFDAGSFDNCTIDQNLRFTFDDTHPDDDPNFNPSFNSSSKFFPPTPATLEQDIFIWDERGNRDFCRVTLQIGSGNEGTDEVVFEFSDVVVPPNSKICVPLTVQNFKDISAFQGSLRWDADVLSFDNVQNFQLPGMDDSKFANPSDGSLTFVWFDPSGLSSGQVENGGFLFDVCFDIIGDDGDFTSLDLTNLPTFFEVGSGSVPIDFVLNDGSVTLDASADCEFTEDDINWPLSVIDIVSSEVTFSNASSTVSPDGLQQFFGFTESEVLPSFDSDCGLIGFAFDDTVQGLNDGKVLVTRDFTVIDWMGGQTFTHIQLIRVNFLDGSICDFLPNSAPFEDCEFGHTMDDDVEWPDDLSVSDHRISPDELVNISNQEFEDTRPIFFNSPDKYGARFKDEINVVSSDEYEVTRCWTASRIDLPSSEWEYCQKITVKNANFPDLVTINTIHGRPIPEVSLAPQVLTDADGAAFTTEDITPSKSDIARNGLTVKDFVLIREYIASIPNSLLSDPLIDEAVDMNRDGIASTIDRLILQRIILGQDETTSTEWMFFKQANPANLDIKGHYKGVKLGDLDDDAVLSGSFSCPSTQKLIIEDQLVNNGEFLEVPLFLEEPTNTRGLELRLDFDADAIDIVEVTSAQVFDEISWNINNDNQIVMLFSNVNGSTEFVNSSTPILSIQVQAKQNGLMKDFIGLTQNDCSYILDSGYDLLGIEGIFDGEILNSNQDINQNLGVRVYPNPASQFVHFDASNVSDIDDIQIELFDMIGERLISTVNAQTVDVNNIPAGMYIYKITINENVQTGRLMISQ